MGKRGPEPQEVIKLKWSANFAYAIGLLVADGCLYNDGRHISLTTKDVEQAENFKECLGIQHIKTGLKGVKDIKDCLHVQFGSVSFYNFLLSIGLTPAKSKTIGAIVIPDKYFFDYLRGYFDGDGCFYSYWDKRWKTSHMFYISFACASMVHVEWLQTKLKDLIGVQGHIDISKSTTCLQLKYAKRESLEIINRMYYNRSVVCLSRKKDKISNALEVEREQQAKYKSARVL